MQEMIQIQAVTAGLPTGVVFRGRVDASQRYALCPRVSRCASLWPSALDMAEQHHWTPSFRQKSAGKQRAIPRRHRSSNRHANLVQVSQKLGFRGDVGLTASSPTRQPQYVALAVRSPHLEAVVEAAMQKRAFDRARQLIPRSQETAHGFRRCSGIARTQRSVETASHRFPNMSGPGIPLCGCGYSS